MSWYDKYKEITKEDGWYFIVDNKLEQSYLKIITPRGVQRGIRHYYYIRISSITYERVYPRYGNMYRLKDKDVKYIDEKSARELFPEEFI